MILPVAGAELSSGRVSSVGLGTERSAVSVGWSGAGVRGKRNDDDENQETEGSGGGLVSPLQGLSASRAQTQGFALG